MVNLSFTSFDMAYYLVHFYVVWLILRSVGSKDHQTVKNVVFSNHDSGGFIYSFVMSIYCSDWLFCHIILFLFYDDGLKCDSVW